MIKNVIFDIGNVILKFTPKEYFASLLKSESLGNEICDLIMQSQIWKEYDLGKCTLEDVKADFSKQKPHLKEIIHEILDQWLDVLEPIAYTFHKMEELRKAGYKLYLLSNLSKDAFDYIDKRYALFDQVDGYIVSFKEQLAKPDERIYTCLLERYSLNKEECVFLDDTKVNVDASNALGLKAIHFVKEEEVEEALNAVLKGNSNG